MQVRKTHFSTVPFRSILLFSITLLLLLTLQSQTALSASFAVDSTLDAVDAAPGDGVCDDGAGNCTLRAAIQEANALAGADLITLGAGTYTLTIAGAGEDFSATGDLDPNSVMTITGAGVGVTTIDGGGIDRVFDFFGSTDAVIEDLTITGGSAPSGGAIIAQAGSDLVFNRVAITGNSATNLGGSGGGGIYASIANVTLTDSTVSGNSTGGAAGGGIDIIANTTLNVINSTISGNNAGSGNGGGINNFNSDVIISNSTISGNSAGGAGKAIYSAESTTSSVQISNSTIVESADAIHINHVAAGSFAQLDHTIVSTAASPACTETAGSIDSLDYNITTDATCGLDAAHDQPSTDPLLGGLTPNGGPTMTHVLGINSPATNAGDPNGTFAAFDQRGTGFDRVNGGIIDIGAFELGITTFTVVAGQAEGADANPGDGICADIGGDCTLRAAVSEANALADHQTIVLPAGTFTMSNATAGDDANITGDLDITDDVTIIGAGLATTSILGDGADRLFDIFPGVNATIIGVQIADGVSSGIGGAIDIDNARLVLDSVEISNNTAVTGGGAIYSDNSSLIVDNSDVRGNNASSGSSTGGGIQVANNGDLAISSSMIRNNQATQGGGLYVDQSSGQFIVEASSIVDNTAILNGGGLFINNGTSAMKITNSTVSGNMALDTGGLFAINGTIFIDFSTIAFNEATDAGLAQNIQSVTAVLRFSNSILSDPVNGSSCDGLAPTDDGNNIEFPNDGCLSGATYADPLLQPLALNGGTVLNHALTAGSSAIDAGSVSCPDVPTDIVGTIRPIGTNCDAGAFEFDPLADPVQTGPTFTVNNSSDIDDFACTVADCSLREAINAANSTINGASPDEIHFNMPVGDTAIVLASNLPNISDPVVIDGYTQPGATVNTLATGNDANLLVEINGAAMGFSGIGLRVDANNTLIRGLVLTEMNTGIVLEPGSSNSFVTGNYVGTDPTGTLPEGSPGGGSSGISVAGDNNTVGGSDPADRNIVADYNRGIGATGDNNTIQGNYVGTNAAGTGALPITGFGIFVGGSGNQFGGSGAGEGNVVVSEFRNFQVGGDNNIIQGNLIGSDATGTTLLPDTGSVGMLISLNATDIAVGGPLAGEGNLFLGRGRGIRAENGATDIDIIANTFRDTRLEAIALSAGTATMGVTISRNTIENSGYGAFPIGSSPAIDLGLDGVTSNDFFDADTGPNGNQNFPVLQRAVVDGGIMTVQGYLASSASSTFDVELYANAACDPSTYGEGETFLGTVAVTTEANGYGGFQVNVPVAAAGSAITALATDQATGNTSEFSRCIIVGPNNDTWPNAFPIALTPSGGDAFDGSAEQFLTTEGQTRWFRFPVAPDSTVIVDLSSLPANYDLTLFRDIAQTYDELNQPQSLEDLAQLSAEFAPDMFTPDMFTPEMFTPEMFTPDMFTPDMFTPDMFTPDMFTPDMFTPDMFTPDMFTPDMFTPDMFTPDMFTPDMFTPDMFTPDMFTPDMFTPDMFTPDQRYYAGALAQSAVAVSAFDGTATETVVANSWNEAGDFYVSVTGRNGAFDLTDSFDLDVTVLGAECNGLTIFDADPDVSGIGSNAFDTLILVDSSRMGDYAAATAKLNQLSNHAAVNGAIVDVSTYPAIVAANTQADDLYTCVFAKNVVAYGIKDIVDAYRANNPNLKYIVAIGNDDVIPFFRYPDQALLANESGYVPPVLDTTASQAQLQNGYVLGQDTYGASVEVDRRNTSIPIPELAVGRLVETADEINAIIQVFIDNNGTISAPDEALVTGYDFLADAANAIEADLLSGLGTNGSVTTLVDQETVAPVNGWSADDLRSVLLDESADYDLVYLAGHFSSFSTLAADNESRVLASELLASSADFTNAIVFSNGCHSGYNLVSSHAVPGVSVEPDWAQVFTSKGAILIAGTGYQYGDTEFVEYGERLYFEFTRELRRGTGPISVGEALVNAKQIYLAETVEMRPIHEKTLLISTLFGLPMTTIDMPGDRYNPADDTIVVAPTPVTTEPGQTTNPGVQLNLETFDLTVTSAISRQVETLENVVDETLVDTIYYYPSDEPDSLVINPGEPILPLDLLRLQATDTVLRGVGFRSGSYTDVLDQIPFTGAATTELRGIHAPFISDVFYPVLPWDVNYFDVLSSSVADGTVNLGVMPVQYRSNASDSIDGTMRVYDDLDFRLFFSDETGAYTNVAEGVTNVPALAGAPVIAQVLATSDGTSVNFEATVTGDPSAGIQTVWVTYTSADAPFVGEWASLDLTQDTNDSRIWRGTLDLLGSSAENLRYLVQAANGVGLVAIDTNRGEYHAPDVDPANPGTPPGSTTTAAPVTLAFVNTPPTSGEYGTSATFSALLTSNGTPLAGQKVQFGLTSQRQTAVTDANGVATVTLTVIGDPATDKVRVTYAGTPGYKSSSAESPFTIEAIATQLTLLTAQPTFSAGGRADLSIALADDTGRPEPWRWVLVVVRDSLGTIDFAESVQTDLFGNANLLTAPLTPDNYTVEAHFASKVTLPGIGTIDMRLPRFEPTTTPDVGDPPIAFITNTPPSADAGMTYTVDEGGSVVLSAAASSDSNVGQALTYAWDLNASGSYETTGITVTYFATMDDGPVLKTVALEVCDPVDDCATATATVDVQNVAPTIDAIVHDAQVGAGEPFTVTIQASDPADVLSYSYDCDGVAGYEVGPTPDSAATCTIATGGNVTITVLVDDGDATASASSTVEVIVNEPPTVTITAPDAVYEGQAAAFDADFLTNGNPYPFIISWSFGDGNTAYGSVTPEHTYTTPGVYDVTLTVTSVINGSSATDTKQVVVLYAFMQACTYVADSGEELTLEKNSVVDCLVWSEGEVTVKDSAEINGDLLSTGAVELDKYAIVTGNVSAGDDVELKEFATVSGDVRSTGEIELKNNATVGGSIFEYDPAPIFPASSALTLSLSAGGPDVEVKKNEVEALSPGSFGELEVKKGATLQLSSGHYQFEEWTIDKDVQIEFDVTNGAIIIDVVGKIEFKKNVMMSVIGGGADQILFRSTGDKFEVDKDSTLVGTYLVLSADAKLKKDTILDGAIYALELKVEDGAQITDARALPVFTELLLDGTLSGGN